METIAALVKGALEMPARQGWIYLIIGLVMLVLVQFEFIPRSEIATGWLLLFWLLFVSGATILIVSFGGWAIEGFRAKRDEKRKVSAKLESQASRGREALRNAKLLDRYRTIQLLSILLKGEQRFIPEGDVYSLWELNIIGRHDPRSSLMYEVTDTVWQARDELIPFLRERMRDLKGK